MNGPVEPLASRTIEPFCWAYYQGPGASGGAILPKERVCVSPDDRGFLLGDGVYEVMRAYQGHVFRPERHLERLARSLAEARIAFDRVTDIGRIAGELLLKNGLTDCDSTVYIQVTRGAHPRRHAFPLEPVAPTVYVEANRLVITELDHCEGVAAITAPDTRWARVDIKSICLLPNVLARQAAVERGAFEAIFVRDGVLTEGSHTNVMGVIKGVVVTHARTNRILPGITRDALLELCRTLAIPVSETCIYQDQLPQLDELFLVGTTVEVLPVLSVDSKAIGSGRPGPVTLRLQAAFRKLVVSG